MMRELVRLLAVLRFSPQGKSLAPCGEEPSFVLDIYKDVLHGY